MEEALNILKYKGYTTKIHYSAPDKLLYGSIEYIKDSVNFESETVEGIMAVFQNAVDDYLDFCQSIGKKPDKPLTPVQGDDNL